MQDMVKPTLLLDEDICKANIHQMADKAEKNDLKLKPHMKTHQSAEVGEWIRDAGVKAITVSSVTMANYFANHGWKDITIAFPANVLQINEINALAAEITITLLVNSTETAKKLDHNLSHPVNTYIEIDTGSERSGIPSDHKAEIHELITTIDKTNKLNWIGFYSHPGHSYQARSREDILSIHHSVLKQFRNLRNDFGPGDNLEICMGDTPCCSVGTDFDGIDAMSPGNFVFYDLMQYQIGSCKISDVAVAAACPVVDKYPNRNELVIYGGAIHFSKEKLNEQSFNHFGRVVTRSNGHWQILDGQSYLKRLSQEHGIVTCSNRIFDDYQIGDVISIMPVHSCLTANLMKEYTLSDGEIIRQMK